MARIQCFLLKETGLDRISLRRFTLEKGCPQNGGWWHTAQNFLCDEPVVRDEEGYIGNSAKPLEPKDHPLWPKQCACGYIFQDTDEWQRFSDTLYEREDTGERLTIRDAPAGAMWEAPWEDRFQFPQGEHNLVVKTPGGLWDIDGQANNCTMPEDYRQEKHHCWIRHGEPPMVTVSKEGGPTCLAGGGSIQCGSYHGFLRAGFLED